VLKPGGHFSISDIVLEGDLPEGIKASAEMYAGCVAGAIQKNDYLDFIEKSGFTNIQIQKQKPILIPDEILLEYLSENELKDFLASGTGIFSITVYAEKPGGEHTEKKKLNLKDLKTVSTEPCCGPGCC
jgi:hypothetical protein